MPPAVIYSFAPLYEDNHIICAVKPVGTLSQSDGSGAPDMLSIIKRYIKEGRGKPGEAYLGLVHRLDRPVGGVMVFAKTSKAAARLSKQIRGRAFVKTYLAIVRGVPGGADAQSCVDVQSGVDVQRGADAQGATCSQEGADVRLVHRIIKTAYMNTVRVYDVEKDGPGVSAENLAMLDYRVIAGADIGESVSLVRVNLVTGRPHQIRAQFAHIGHPVLGDRKYGATRPRQGAQTAGPQGRHIEQVVGSQRRQGAQAAGPQGRHSEQVVGSQRRQGAQAAGPQGRQGAQDEFHANRNARGKPRAGDIPDRRAEGPALWAASLEFAHPVGGTIVIVSAPPPCGYPWELFPSSLYSSMY